MERIDRIQIDYKEKERRVLRYGDIVFFKLKLKEGSKGIVIGREEEGVHIYGNKLNLNENSQLYFK